MGILLQSIAVSLVLALSVSLSFAAGAGQEWRQLNQEVMSLYKQGKYEQALIVAKKALAMAESKAGKGHPDVASSLNNLAELYRAKGDYAQAEPLYKRALTINEKALSPDDPAIAISMHNLVLSYFSQGKYTQAEPYCKRSLAIMEKAYGPDHLEISLSLGDLAGAYYGQRRFDEAEPLYKRALAISEKALGPDHPAVATVLNNLAVLYESDGRYGEAAERYQRVLSIMERTGRPDNFNAAAGLRRLAGFYRTMGRQGEANALDRAGKENDLYCNAVLRAAAEGNPDAVMAAIRAGGDLNSHQTGKYAAGYTPLHVAAEKGHLEVVKTLIQNGAVVDARDEEMNTPLLLAVRNNGTLGVVKYLVEHGADIRAKNNRGAMPLIWASHGNAEYIHAVNRKLLGKNRYEVFGKVIKFKKVFLGNEGKSLWGGKTAEPCTLIINGKVTDIPRGTWLNSGGFAYMIFPRDMSLTVGPNDILFAKKEPIWVSFDEKSGNVTTQAGVPATNMTLTVGSFRIPFFAKRYHPGYVAYRGQASMHFYDNGAIKEGYVGKKDFPLKLGANEIIFKGDEIMEFDEDGGIKSGVMAYDTTLEVGGRNIVFRGDGRSIATFPDGKIRSGDLARDTAIPVGERVVDFKKGSTLTFHENGSVRSGTIGDAMPFAVDGQTNILESQKLYFQENGSLKMIYEGYKYKN